MSLEEQVNETEHSPRAVLLRALQDIDKGDVTDIVVILEADEGTAWHTSRPISYATSLGMAMLCVDGLRKEARAASRETEEDGV